MGTTNFTTLVYGSPAKKMYHTGAVTSPNNRDDVETMNCIQAVDNLKD